MFEHDEIYKLFPNTDIKILRYAISLAGRSNDFSFHDGKIGYVENKKIHRTTSSRNSGSYGIPHRKPQEMLSHKPILPPTPQVYDNVPKPHVEIGSLVTIQNIESGYTDKYKIVNSGEANVLESKISIDSPVGSAILGKTIAEEVEVVPPSGIRQRYRILDIL